MGSLRPMAPLKAEAHRLSTPLPGGGESGTTVTVEPLLGGEVQAPRAFFESRGGRLSMLRAAGVGTPRSRWSWAPVPAYLITHPTAGPILVDTAFHGSVAARPAANLGRVMARLSRARVKPGRDIPSQLRDRGIDARKLGTVILTHLHFDHASGVSEYPTATFLLSQQEWDAFTSVKRPITEGYRLEHIDYLFDYRTVDFDRPGVTSYASFSRTFDVFGDGSVRLAYTPGHTRGHCSVIARLRDRDFVISGDAVYTRAQLDGSGDPPPRPADMHTWKRSVRELQQFARTYPRAVITTGHDRDDFARLASRYE
jgi:N-acyl homoserine lactone hydrolase